jgi:glucose/arabinose dehydrogenase
VTSASWRLIGAAPAAGRTSSRAIGAEQILSGLDFPAAFTFARDGRIFYGERFNGEIHISNPSTGSDTLFFTVTDLSTTGEQGLLGLALHPRYPSQPFVYAYATRVATDGSLHNEILRIRDDGGVGTTATVIWSSETVAGDYHDGGRILFGPDRKLYAVVGEAHDSSNAQDLTNDAGKVLRMTASGAVPADNPFPGSLIWSYGLRNSFGFTFDPVTGNLWETENGPQCNDEINLIVKGGNFGWGPSWSCLSPPPPPENTNQDGPSPILPLSFFTPTIAPVGAAFCNHCGLPSSQGTMFFGAYNTDEIQQVVLTADRLHIQSVTTVFTHSSFPLSLERGPDGAIYFSDGTGIWKLISAEHPSGLGA